MPLSPKRYGGPWHCEVYWAALFRMATSSGLLMYHRKVIYPYLDIPSPPRNPLVDLYGVRLTRWCCWLQVAGFCCFVPGRLNANKQQYAQQHQWRTHRYHHEKNPPSNLVPGTMVCSQSFIFFCNIHFHFPVKLVGRFTLSGLPDKSWP